MTERGSVFLTKFSTMASLVLVTLFVSGYLATVSKLDGYALAYLCAVLLIILSSILMFRRLEPPTLNTLPLWFCLGYFLFSYGAKFFLILLLPASPAEMGTVGPLCLPVEFKCQNTYVHSLFPYDWTTLSAEAKAISLAAICIAGFCLAASVGRYPAHRKKIVSFAGEEAVYGKILLALALVLSVATAILFHRYQIGLMGSVVKTELPYRLRGIVYFMRTILLPGMLYLSVYIAYRNRSFLLMVLGIALIIGNGGLDVFFRSSRSALLFPILGLFLLALSADIRLRVKTLMWTVIALIPVFTSIPYVSAYRVNRINLDAWSAITKTFADMSGNPVLHFAKGFAFVFFRFTGIDVLASMLGHEAQPIGSFVLDVIRTERGVSGYLSTEIFGIPANYPGASAPGFVGWCYLVGGVPGVLMGGVLLALAVRFMWAVLLKAQSPTIIVARVFFLLTLFLVVSDGTVDTLRRMVFVMLATVLVLELGARSVTMLLRNKKRSAAWSD